MENFECRNTEIVLEKFQVVTPIFQALGDGNRQQIIMLLLENKHMNVTQITDKMGISRPAVSHHLKILKQAELIVADRNGKEIFYSIIAGDFLKQVKDLLQAIESNY
ncbi:metalloregulator ArsR/SmtB family transcription factor [Bacillus paramycoides]|uniref:ArsR/SmtB family transcription factor n=1 Tax=Bacillus paramycoides TaxID=2026194 RepID=UPI002E225EA4|nr:metalloregulator ArsR/SmtB family transcription factor [Bacillus paramycoides]MED1464510.1 metalloregulator ArsR/SmtB family transcription factor [Bacillus paramycoides]MED1491471.1 metalloregulator ArsR/SmtB family transcription factor [Bacillus paramycoides]